jgi:hypothetical protein
MNVQCICLKKQRTVFKHCKHKFDYPQKILESIVNEKIRTKRNSAAATVKTSTPTLVLKPKVSHLHTKFL